MGKVTNCPVLCTSQVFVIIIVNIFYFEKFSVIPAWEEPIPGWVDNLNGPTGLLTAAGKGVLRTMHCNGKYDADLIPVDVVCNGLIAIAWKFNTDLDRWKNFNILIL